MSCRIEELYQIKPDNNGLTQKQFLATGTRMPKVRRITIEGFRGVPGRISIDLCRTKTGDALSSIIVGDNGTGKSTLVDAVELALQGTYRRTKRLKSNALPSLLNLNGPRQSSTIEVVFDNHSSVSKTISSDSLGGLNFEPTCHSDFQLAPIALRRKDCLLYTSDAADE